MENTKKIVCKLSEVSGKTANSVVGVTHYNIEGQTFSKSKRPTFGRLVAVGEGFTPQGFRIALVEVTLEVIPVLAKNSFNSHCVIITPTKVPDLFPLVGQTITRTVSAKRRHYSGKATGIDDLQVYILQGRQLMARNRADEPWALRSVLPRRTFVVGPGRLN